MFERALELHEETVAHRRWLHRNAEVGLHMPKAQAYVIELGNCETPDFRTRVVQYQQITNRVLWQRKRDRRSGSTRTSARLAPPVWHTARSAG